MLGFRADRDARRGATSELIQWRKATRSTRRLPWRHDGPTAAKKIPVSRPERRRRAKKLG